MLDVSCGRPISNIVEKSIASKSGVIGEISISNSILFLEGSLIKWLIFIVGVVKYAHWVWLHPTNSDNMQSSKGEIHKQSDPSKYLKLLPLHDKQLSYLSTQVRQLALQGLHIFSLK